MEHITPSLIRFVLISLCAALAIIEQVRLGWRAQKHHKALALAVPGLGAYEAWDRGERAGPAVWAIALVAYLVLRFAP